MIAAGRRPTRVARKIATQSRGRTRVVEILGRGGRSAHPRDLVVTYGHQSLPHHRCRIETIAPLNAVTPERLEAAAARAPAELVDSPRPRVLLLTGRSPARQISAKHVGQMAEEAHGFAEAAGGSVFALTSSDTEADVALAIRAAVGVERHAVATTDPKGEDTILRYLALADAIVVTGDCPFLLAKAAACGTPVYIHPASERVAKRGGRIARWVESRTHAQPKNRRGTTRPQKHLEYLCARLIERGIVKPPLNLDALHRALVERGTAQWFGDFSGKWESSSRSPMREADEVARAIRSMLGRRSGNEPLRPSLHRADGGWSQAQGGAPD